MIAKDLVTDVFIVTHSMRQISTLTHMEAVAPIKLILSSPSTGDFNDWRMALQQGIRERRQVLREAHRLQRTERPTDYSAPNCSRSCEIDVESA